MLLNGLDALSLPLDMITEVAKTLEGILASDPESRARTMLVHEPILPEFVTKLAVHKYEFLADNDKILLKFLSDAFPHVCDRTIEMDRLLTQT